MSSASNGGEGHSTPSVHQHRLACGCLWRYTTRMGWFLVDLGPNCPTTTDTPHPVKPKLILDFDKGEVRHAW